MESMIEIEDIASNLNIPEIVLRDLFSFKTHKKLYKKCQLPDLSNILCIPDEIVEVSEQTANKICHIFNNLNDNYKKEIYNAYKYINDPYYTHFRKDLRKYNKFYEFLGHISAIDHYKISNNRFYICIDHIREWDTGNSIMPNVKNPHVWVSLPYDKYKYLNKEDFIRFEAKVSDYESDDNMIKKYSLSLCINVEVLSFDEVKKWWNSKSSEKIY